MSRGWRLAIAVGALLDIAVFGVQGFQIHILNRQQTQINHNAAKNDCWSHVLDLALNEAPVRGATKASLTAAARICARIP